MLHRSGTAGLVCLLTILTMGASAATEVPLYGVHEIDFVGPHTTPTDQPSRSEFYTEWEHEEGTRHRIHGFWDGNGQGGTSGTLYRVRFCPTLTGTWTLVSTRSGASQLEGQHEGYVVQCVPSDNHGFWEPDGLWFKRSDGSHQYMLGNVHYCLVSVDSRLEDIRANKNFYKKLRFMIQGFGLCEASPPFFNSSGNGSSSGNDAKRPNPAYFARIDEMVREGLAHDLIIDMYTSPQNYAIDQPGYLRYLAARFGSFPNVWLQMDIEWNEKYSSSEIRDLAVEMRSHLPYPTPLTTISTKNWNSGLNSPCWTHVNIQGKVFGLRKSALAIIQNRETGGGIICNNDDNGPNFENYGGTTGPMEVERTLGCFLGAGYTGTGYKTGYKKGPYMFGGFDPDIHTCTRPLKYMRKVIDSKVCFWKMRPSVGSYDNASGFVWMGWTDSQYVFGSNTVRSGVTATLPEGSWKVEQFDFMDRSSEVLSSSAPEGNYEFDTPNSVSAMTLFTRTDVTSSSPRSERNAPPPGVSRTRAGLLVESPTGGMVRVTDIAGRVVTVRHAARGTPTLVAMRGRPAGTYVVEILTGHGARRSTAVWTAR